MIKNEICTILAQCTVSQQEDLLTTIVWSLRQKILMVPRKEKIKIEVQGHRIVAYHNPEVSFFLTVVPVSGDCGTLKAVADCLNIVFSQENPMALDVVKSFTELNSKKRKISHMLCILVKAMIPDEGVFLNDRQMIFLKKENHVEELLFTAPLGIENHFIQFLAGRVEEKKKPVVLY